MRHRRGFAITVAILLIPTIVLAQHLGARRTFEGALEGDLEASGLMEMVHKSAEGQAYIALMYPSLFNGSLTATVSNVSRVHMLSPPDGKDIDAWIPVPNGTFAIVVQEGSISGHWRDIDFRGRLSELTGSFMSREQGYTFRPLTSSFQGTARIIHGEEDGYDISLSDEAWCVIDGVAYKAGSWLNISGGEVASIELRGSGYVELGSDMQIIIDGDLHVEDFKRTNVLPAIRYQDVTWEGRGMTVRVLQTASFYTHWGDVYDPEIIRVTIPRDAKVTSMASYTLLMVMSIIVITGTAWAIALYRSRRRMEGHMEPDAWDRIVTKL